MGWIGVEDIAGEQSVDEEVGKGCCRGVVGCCW